MTAIVHMQNPCPRPEAYDLVVTLDGRTVYATSVVVLGAGMLATHFSVPAARIGTQRVCAHVARVDCGCLIEPWFCNCDAEDCETIEVLPGLPPRWINARVEHGLFRATVVGEPSTGYTVESSTDLRNWTPLTMIMIGAAGTLEFTDPLPAALPCRWYRAGPP